MESGVTIIDPASAFIGPDVTIGADTIIHPGVYLEGRTAIGSGCVINSGVRIVDSRIDDGVVINNFCVISESHVVARRAGRSVRPHPAAVGRRRGCARRQLRRAEEDDARAGDRRPTTSRTSATRRLARRSTSAPARSPATTTASHKHPTVIEDGAFIGSDSQLIAPVRVGEGAYVAAGSSITEDVPAGCAGHRARQADEQAGLGGPQEEPLTSAASKG